MSASSSTESSQNNVHENVHNNVKYPHLVSDAMTIIVPITEMRDTSKMFELSENEPVFITKNGYGSRVLMNVDLYNKIENILFDLELQERCRRAKTDGKSVDAVEYIQGLINDSLQGKDI